MESLGLDIKLLMAQIINFGILFFILNRVLYKPIIKILDDRKKNIITGQENSKKIDEELNKLEEKKLEVISNIQNEAKKDKDLLIIQAREEKRNIIDEAKKASDAIVVKSIQRIKATEEQSYENIKKRFINEAVNDLLKKINSLKVKEEFNKKVIN